MRQAEGQYVNPHLILESGQVKPGEVAWRSPSNIALVKYWGKHGRQLPRNPSVSFTLQHAHTETRLHYRPKEESSPEITIDFFFEGAPKPDFADRIRQYFESLKAIFPFLPQLEFSIYSKNAFPHSAGIASSASAMSALALCLCSLEEKLFDAKKERSEFLRKASYIARLGSGSACRSLYGGAVVWGKTIEVEGSSDEFALPLEDVHPDFLSFRDDILLVSTSEKAVSSSAGHALMDSNPYAEARYADAQRNLQELVWALRQGELEAFGRIVESEALTLHGLMFSSRPPYLLLEPNTITSIQKIQAFRKETRLPLYFSLDAGPNLHLLYPDAYQKRIKSFIQDQLAPLCSDGQYLSDEIGEGPVAL
jgi:diphosphomevalonate decarboxylase